LKTGSNFIATLTLGGAGVHGSYYHKANDQVNVLQQNDSCLYSFIYAVLLIYNDLCFVVFCISCRLVWSLKRAPVCRRLVHHLGTSWTSPKPTCSLKVGTHACMHSSRFHHFVKLMMNSIIAFLVIFHKAISESHIIL